MTRDSAPNLDAERRRTAWLDGVQEIGLDDLSRCMKVGTPEQVARKAIRQGASTPGRRPNA